MSISCGLASSIDTPGDESGGSDVIYELVVSVNPPEGGRLFPAAYSGEEYMEGTQVTITAFPNEGYSFSHWQGDVSGEMNPIVVTMDSSKEISALFTEESDESLMYTLRTRSDPPDGGSILPSIPPEGRAYPANTKVTVTAVPAEGYRFLWWEGVVEAAPYYVIMDSDKEIVANFAKQSDEPVTLTVVVEPAEGGSVYLKDVGNMPTGFGFEYEPDTTVELTATPNDGYHFDHWELYPGMHENVYPFAPHILLETIKVTLCENQTVYAYFEEIPEEPQDEPLPPARETLYTSFEGEGQCTATQSSCSCNMVISIEGIDLTDGSYPVTSVTLTVNGENWHDSGSISETHYSKTVERSVACDAEFHIEVIATNSVDQTINATGYISTARN